MRYKILFTKTFLLEEIQNKLGSDFEPLFINVIQTLSVKTPLEISDYQNFIITSYSAIEHFVKKAKFSRNSHFFVVGEKSAKALKEMGYVVTLQAKNAEILSQQIIKEIPKGKIMHLCSSIALKTLENKLSEAGYTYVKNVVYTTEPLFPVNNEKADALVFFSPSGVESYFKNNKVEKEEIFAIGKTTQKTLEKYTTKKIIRSEKENLEDLLQVIKTHYHA